MALRFRKSVKLFPGVRLNFSTSGISTTIGVHGASVNLGKRGAHFNLGIPGSGLSWRSQLFPGQPSADERRSPLNPPPTLPAIPAASPEQQGEIRSADVSYLTSAGLEEFKRLINEASLRRKTLSQSVTDGQAELAAAELRLRNAQRFFLRLFYSKAKTLRLAHEVQEKRELLKDTTAELAACSINVDFAFDQATINSFAALVRTFEELSHCTSIWDITGSIDTNRAKERTLATQSISRIPVTLKLVRSEIIESRFPALLFPNANGDDLYIYPGFVMTKSQSSDFALVDIREVDVVLRRSRFVEEETVPPNRRAFCKRMAELVEADFVPVTEPRQVLVGSDVVICATSSNVPVFDGTWLEPGQHLTTLVGSNSALVKGGWLKEGRRENDDETVRRADFIITNWRESIEQERQAGIFDPIQKGIITWEKIHELGEILEGTFPGRISDEQITFHANNNGTAAADLAIAQWVYEQCRKMGRGSPIELPRPGDQ